MKRLALVLFGLMALGCYLRLFFSVGLLGYMDESYWVASSLLSSLGGKPYVDELYIQQTAALLYEPLVALYYKLAGSFGLILFVRHLYFVLALACAWIWFRLWRDRVEFVIAAAIALLPLVGSFWGEPSLGYNAIGCLGFGTGMLLAVRGLEARKSRWVGLSGVFFALALGAYPTLLGGFLLFWILCAGTSRQPVLRPLVLNCCVTGTLVGLFLLSIVWRAGFENVELVYRFSTAHSSLGSFAEKISYGFWLWLAFLPPLWFWLPLFALWFSLWLKKGLEWQFFALPMCMFMLLKAPPEDGPIHPSLVLALAVSGLPLVWRSGWANGVLYSCGLLSVALTCWSSALTVYVTYVTATSCLAVVYAQSRPRREWIALLTFAIPVTIFCDRIAFRAFDDHSSDMEMFASGPNAGIFTSTERYAFLNQLQSDVDEVSRDARSVLFYPEFPLGYLMSSLRPATRTMFLHGLRESGPAIQDYFRQFYSVAGNRPDVIFRFKYFVENGVRRSMDPADFGPDAPRYDVFWNYLPSDPEYSLALDRPSYSVFRRLR